MSHGLQATVYRIHDFYRGVNSEMWCSNASTFAIKRIWYPLWKAFHSFAIVMWCNANRQSLLTIASGNLCLNAPWQRLWRQNRRKGATNALNFKHKFKRFRYFRFVIYSDSTSFSVMAICWSTKIHTQYFCCRKVYSKFNLSCVRERKIMQIVNAVTPNSSSSCLLFFFFFNGYSISMQESYCRKTSLYKLLHCHLWCTSFGVQVWKNKQKLSCVAQQEFK